MHRLGEQGQCRGDLNYPQGYLPFGSSKLECFPFLLPVKKPLPSPGLYTRQENGRLVDPKLDPIEDASRSELREKICEVLSALPEQQQEVIRLRFGLEDGTPLTLRETGEIQGYSQENVRRYEMNALRSLKMPLSRSKLIPFVIEPGSSEILETLAVDLFFVGLPPKLERDWQTLLARGENFQYLPYGFEDSLLPSLTDPLKKSSGQMRRIRLGSLATDTAWHFHKLFRKNSFQPLVFDLSDDTPLADKDLQARRERGRSFFRGVLSNLVHGHLTRILHAAVPTHVNTSDFYWKIRDVREKGESERVFSPWVPADPRFKKLQVELRDFGVDVSFDEKTPQSRWLNFKPLAL